MTGARDEVLARIRGALAGAAVAVPGTPGARVPAVAPADPVGTFLEQVRDYGATATTVAGGDAVAAALRAALERHAAREVVAPAGLPAAWLPAGVDVALDDPPLSVAAIARADAVVTTCAHAVADTGTVVLAGGPGEGRRVLSLLSDLHVCVVEAARIVPSLDAAFASLAGVTGPVTLVSGPSATSDIELTRVEGVHGPRRLEVVVVGA